ncbi:hypothetical protein AABB24_038480 [Solanum stoloniferum]|uniref:Uncharacterized protein n=1 Tax=Solanum stoloniferum TaxID=62892 RepID=A0ABD2QYU2_9SOLN
MTDSPIDENEVQSHISRTRGSTISRANNSSKSDQNLDTSNSATSRAKNSNKNDQNLDTSISTRKITRCYFKIDITDNTGTLTAIVTETLAEKILAMRAEQVYGIVVVQGSTTKAATQNSQSKNW